MKPRYKPARRIVTIEELRQRSAFIRLAFAEWYEMAAALPPDPDVVVTEDDEGWTIAKRVVDAG